MTRVLVALGVAVVVGAAALPVGSAGVGWLIAALAGLGVAVTARTVRGRLNPPPPPAPAPTPLIWSSLPPAPVQQPVMVPGPLTLPAPAPTTTVEPATTTAEPTTGAEFTAVPPVPAPLPAPVRPPYAPVQPPESTPQTTGDRAWRIAAGVSALLLAAVPAIRASGPLTVLCVVAGLLLGSYALVGGRTWGGIVTGGVALIGGFFLGIGWLATYRPAPRATSEAHAPDRTAPWRVVLAIGLSFLLAAILIPILRSADPVFAELIDSWLGYVPRLNGRTIVGALALAGVGLATAYFVHEGPRDLAPRTERNRPLAGLEWLIPLVVVDAIFTIFVVVQINVLFAGHAYVLGAGGPDYAEYARGGFGELCFVTVLSLGLVALLGALAQRHTLRQRLLIRIVGGLLCALTLVIVASAVKRMLLYVDAYGFTWLRLLSFAFELWLGVVFVLVLLAGIALRGSWLPRVAVAAATGVLFALVAANPEAVMARTHIDARLNGPYAIDYSFLNNLSADAVDEILRLPADTRDCGLHSVRTEVAQRHPWYEFNLAEYHAATRLHRVTEQPCASAARR